MAKFRFLAILTAILLLTACSTLAYKDMSKPAEKAAGKNEQVNKGDGTVKFSDEGLREVAAPEAKNQKEDKKEEKQIHKPDEGKVLQPESRLGKGEKLDFDSLSKLDNTRYAWWITMNNEHKTPGIPAIGRKLLTEQNGVYIGDVSKKIVYLTFDEGYENGYTAKILDALKANDVKALFFVTGPYIKKETALVKRMLEEGHQVGNHSINHPSLPGVTLPQLENELFGLEKDFSSMYGKGFKYMRPPRGEYSERTMAAAKQLGYKTVFWSFAYRDFETNNQKGPDYAYNMVTKNLHNGAVLLLHAVSKDNAEALDRIIKEIKAQGYTISPFDL